MEEVRNNVQSGTWSCQAHQLYPLEATSWQGQWPAFFWVQSKVYHIVISIFSHTSGKLKHDWLFGCLKQAFGLHSPGDQSPHIAAWHSSYPCPHSQVPPPSSLFTSFFLLRQQQLFSPFASYISEQVVFSILQSSTDPLRFRSNCTAILSEQKHSRILLNAYFGSTISNK